MSDSPPRLTLYAAPGCCLCDDMKRQLEMLARELDFALEVVDISRSPELEARFRTEIPVLCVNERKVAKYRASDEELRRAIRARTA